jgi:ketosteroid isomerase-like protein
MHPARRYRLGINRDSTSRRWADQWRNAGRAAAAAGLIFVLFGSLAIQAAPGAQNQRNSKDKKQAEMPPLSSVMPLPDAQAIELMVSQMLGAWQIGDAEMMQKHYADDVLVVSGAWEPPLQGWKNYLRAYQAQRARTQSARMDRRNTFIKVQGDAAWCTYQWEFNGQVDGNPSSAEGHTTLVLQKRAGNWIIVLNHTSIVPTPQRPVPASAAPPGPQSESRPTSAESPGA